MDRLSIIYKSVDELKMYEKNARKNAKAVPVVMESIQEFGFKNPIIIDNKNEIVCGHTRVLAARELGISEVPCVVADDLTPEQIKAFRLIDNKTSEFADWDFELLAEELEELADISGINMEDFGFEMPENIDNIDLAEFFRDKEPEEERREESRMTESAPSREENAPRPEGGPAGFENPQSMNTNETGGDGLEKAKAIYICPHCGKEFEV